MRLVVQGIYAYESAKEELPTKKLPNTEIIRAVIICLWDNVSGPRTEQVWEGTGELSLEMLNYICRYTLGGEITSSSAAQDDATVLQTKFHMLPQYDFLVSAVVFTGDFYSGDKIESTTKWALCVLVDRCHLRRYMQLHKAFEENLTLLASMFQKLLETNPPQQSVEQINSRIELFVKRVTFLTACQTPEWEFNSTFFGDTNVQLSREFLSRAVTSHLQTHGCSVVVGSGEDEEKINMMVNTLMLFLSIEERQLCSHVRKEGRFIPNLMVQGIVSGDFDKSATLMSILPTTVVDVSKQIIYQLCAIRQHAKARETYRANEIESINKSGKVIPDTMLKEENLFKQFKEPSMMVHSFLNEVFCIPVPLRISHIQHFRRFLERKAVVLIRAVERMNEEKRKTNAENLSTNELRRIKTDILRLSNDSDLTLILAIAEGIFPGITVSIYGNLQQVVEKRFNDLWGLN